MSRLADLLPGALKTLRPMDHVGIARVYPGYEVLLELTGDRSAISMVLNDLRDQQQALLKTPNSPLKRSRSFEDLASALTELPDKLPDQRLREPRQLAIVLLTDDFTLLPSKRTAEVSDRLIKGGAVVHTLIDAQHAGVVIARTNIRALRTVTPMRRFVQDRCGSFFAEETGGQVVPIRRGDYESAIQTLINGVSNAYLVGFKPPEQELDGTWHRLEIGVNSTTVKGNAKVRHRRRYWAAP